MFLKACSFLCLHDSNIFSPCTPLVNRDQVTREEWVKSVASPLSKRMWQVVGGFKLSSMKDQSLKAVSDRFKSNKSRDFIAYVFFCLLFTASTLLQALCVQCHVYVACSIWSVPRAFSISTDLASAILRMTLMIGPFPQASNQVERFHDLKSQHLATTIANEFSSVSFSSLLPLPRDESLMQHRHASRVLSLDAQAAILRPDTEHQPLTHNLLTQLQPDIFDVPFNSSTPWAT